MKNIGLINQVVLRYANLGVEYDDLWQTGFFGLHKAIDILVQHTEDRTKSGKRREERVVHIKR